MVPDDLLKSLLSSLSVLTERAGERGLTLNVSLCDAQEVVDLKQRVSDLEAEREQLVKRVNAAEFQARCDSIICLRVVDFARDNGLRIPRSLYDGLDKF